MLVLKNRYAAALSGANCHPRLSHSIQLLKNIRAVMIIWFTDQKIFTVGTATSPNDRLYNALQQPRRKTSRQSVCAHDQRSLMTSVDESQVVANT